MTRDGHHEVLYRYVQPQDATPDTRWGTLRLSRWTATSALSFARLGGLAQVGAWRQPESGPAELELSIPREARLIFDTFARVLDGNNNWLTEDVRQRLYILSQEIRDGVSMAFSQHPEAVELSDLKDTMTRSLMGELVEA